MFQPRFWWVYLLIALAAINIGIAANLHVYFGFSFFAQLASAIILLLALIFTKFFGRSQFTIWIRRICYPLSVLIVAFLMSHGTTHLINGGLLKATCAESDSSFYYRGYCDGITEGYNDGLNECVYGANKVIDSLQTLLDSCQSGKITKKPTATKKPVKAKKLIAKQEPKIIIKETFIPPTLQEISGGYQDSVSVDMTKYGPVFSGDYGTTTSIELTIDKAYILYYVSDEALRKTPGNITVPRVFDEEMISYDYGGRKYWIWINYQEKLTSELITGSHYFPWSIYIGQFNGNGFSYPMYWPHEAVKGLMQQVRGRGDGEVTSSDLQEMGKYNPGIAKGAIRPNNRFATGSDGKRYEGWEFYTRINYVIR